MATTLTQLASGVRPHSPRFLRTGNNYCMDTASADHAQHFPDPSLTQQQFAEEADINTIVDRFMKSGVLPDPVNMPQYMDYEGVFDFQSAMNVVREADLNFSRLDPKVRARFNNSPQTFLEFFADPANKDEGLRLGLIVPQAAPAASADTPPPPPSPTQS